MLKRSENKIYLIWLLLLVSVILPVSAREKINVGNDYRSLAWQLSQLDLSESEKQILENYLTVETSPEAAALIIQDSFYSHIPNASEIKADGKSGDWPAGVQVFPDPAGDGTEGLDLTGFSVLPDGKGNLFVRHEVKGLSSKKKEQGLILNIDLPGKYWLQFIYNFYDNPDQAYYNVIEYGKSGGESIIRKKWVIMKYGAAETGEIILPVSEILKSENIPLTDWVLVQGAVSGDWSDYKYPVPLNGQNPALILLSQILRSERPEGSDTMAAAIALANSHLYALSDDATRRQILKDVITQYRLYRTVADWQISQGYTKHNLSTYPVYAQLAWADRRRTSETEYGYFYTEKYYMEFIDRPEILLEIHRMLLKNNLTEDRPLLDQLAQRTEHSYYPLAKYRSSMENLTEFNRLGMFRKEDLEEARKEFAAGEYEKMYFGKKRRWDGFAWINYQYKLYKEKGYFKGDCGTATTVQMAFYRAIGLAPLSFQYIGQSAAKTHNFPAYYNPYLDRWDFFQKADFEKMTMYLHYSKPYWHPLQMVSGWSRIENNRYASPYYPVEITDSGRMYQFFLSGFPGSVFLEHLSQNKVFEKGLITGKETLRYSDADGDGLSDTSEKKLGTNQNSPDTDGDGYSDKWESEFSDPLVKASERPSEIVLDGLVETAGKISGNSPSGDSKAEKEIFDVAELHLSLQGKKLYAGIRFHNDIRKNKIRLHSFSIHTDKKRYWVQWYKGTGRYYEIKDGKTQPVEKSGLSESVLTDAEFLIPADDFLDADSVTITYYAPGFYNGKEQIVADSSRNIRFRIQGQNLVNLDKGEEGVRVAGRSLPEETFDTRALQEPDSVWFLGE